MNFLVLFSMYFDGVLHSISKDVKADSFIVLRWGNNQLILHGVLLIIDIIGSRT